MLELAVQLVQVAVGAESDGGHVLLQVLGHVLHADAEAVERPAQAAGDAEAGEQPAQGAADAQEQHGALEPAG